MLILAFMMNAAMATTSPAVENCVPNLELTDDRGADFYDRIAVAAATWYRGLSDPRVPTVLNYNVVEVRHAAEGAGSAIVELQTKIGRHRLPIFVRVRYERDRINTFSVADRGHVEFGEPTRSAGRVAENAAMATLLMSTQLPVKNLTATVLSSFGYPKEFSEVLVSALINNVALEKIYLVFGDQNGVAQVDDSGKNRYPYALLAATVEQLLNGPKKDPTFAITAIERQSLDSWRVLYTRGKMERVTDEELQRRTPKTQFGNPVKIRPTSNVLGRVVLKGDGWTPRSKLLRVDGDHNFSLVDDPRR